MYCKPCYYKLSEEELTHHDQHKSLRGESRKSIEMVPCDDTANPEQLPEQTSWAHLGLDISAKVLSTETQ